LNAKTDAGVAGLQSAIVRTADWKPPMLAL
jgi:hypothetical protein